ncbi:hypothetical protein YDYSY3_38020 [Paenibacillus chitinolyticus]|uniref:hypothetical protein n=1 Tax=Paenibacillus chitinolyticus TaxID=79263 RepID=UPI0026E4F74D|nr:hypothetical protein [Paenibacillus chitinolyticus]GKS12802.1 hypothetical protein YDYSY3_38020 [Paenibacillus chitinolyticus]
MAQLLNPVQESNIHAYLGSMPGDIRENIEACTEKWLAGESSYGYPHPVQVCENIQAVNARQPFLTLQQSLDLLILKNHLQSVFQAI